MSCLDSVIVLRWFAALIGQFFFPKPSFELHVAECEMTRGKLEVNKQQSEQCRVKNGASVNETAEMWFKKPGLHGLLDILTCLSKQGWVVTLKVVICKIARFG